jgi:hypothetical protein
MGILKQDKVIMSQIQPFEHSQGITIPSQAGNDGFFLVRIVIPLKKGILKQDKVIMSQIQPFEPSQGITIPSQAGNDGFILQFLTI